MLLTVFYLMLSIYLIVCACLSLFCLSPHLIPSLWHRMERLSRPAAKTVVRPINRPGYIQLMLRERWQSDIHWHMKHDNTHKVWGMFLVNGILSVFRESCKHGKVLTTIGRFQNSLDVQMGEGPNRARKYILMDTIFYDINIHIYITHTHFTHIC